MKYYDNKCGLRCAAGSEKVAAAAMKSELEALWIRTNVWKKKMYLKIRQMGNFKFTKLRK